MATSNSTITIDDGDDNSANTSSNKKRKFEVNKGRPKDSFVWSYIEDHGDYRICKIKVNISSENPDGICNKKIKNNNSTSNCISHLLHAHGILQPNEKEKLELKKQTDIRDFSKQKTITKKEKDDINKKLLEFIIEDAQPFYILKSNSFQSFVQSLNPSYNLPTQEKIDEMLEYNYQNIQNLLIEIMERESKYISLTSDFWTSRGKHGYLGVTCHWISNEYQPQEALLSLVHIPYPHTSEVICQKLREIIFSWKLEEKIICITTDSGSNFIKAVRLLQRVFFDLKRVSCNAHTLNLVVRKSLKINTAIQKFILRVKRLTKFFSSPKRCEVLEKEQENLNYPKIYKIINDVCTRWNSAYYSWQRLILLKDAITHLPSRYRSDQNKEVRKEANKLERILLSESEWILMNDLVVVLKDFEEITRKLSGTTYITFSLIYPSIYTLIKKLQGMLPESTHLSIDKEFEDSSEQLQLDEQEDLFNIQDILEDEEADEILILDSIPKKKYRNLP